MPLPPLKEAPPHFEGLGRAAAGAALRGYLARCGVDQFEADARLLLRAACGATSLDVMRDPHAPLAASEAALLRAYAERRARREPASRILGRRGFWSLELAVAPDVLDPRGDSEALVRLALRGARPPRAIADFGVGSGALLCALLAEYPQALGVGVDISAAACRAARANLRLCGLSSRGAAIRADWGASLAAEAFDLIVSNPPYIPAADIEGLEPEVVLHDPILALSGGADGLEAYRRVFQSALPALRPRGRLIVEAGVGQAEAIIAIAAARGCACVDAENDFEGVPRALRFDKIS